MNRRRARLDRLARQQQKANPFLDVSRAEMEAWAAEYGVTLDFDAPRRPASMDEVRAWCAEVGLCVEGAYDPSREGARRRSRHLTSAE